MRLSSKPGAIIHPFEPQFLLQGAFHGKSALSVCSNGVFETTDKADFLIGGGEVGDTRYEALIFRARQQRQRRKQIESLRTKRINQEGMMGEGTGDG